MSKPTDWRLVALLCAAGALASAQAGKVPPLLPLLRAEYGLGLFAASWLLSLFTLMGASCGFIAGRAAEALETRRACLAGVALLALGGAMGALAPGYGALLASRAVEGCGLLAIVVAAPGLVRRAVAPADLPRAFALWGASTPAGVALAMALAPLLAQGGWRLVWAATGLLALGFLWPLSRALRRAEAPPPQRHGWPSAASLRFGAAFGCYTLAWYTVVGFLPTLLIERLHWPAAWVGLLTAGVVAMNILGNLLAGRLRGRGWSPARAGLLAALGMALFGLGVFAPLPPLLAFACCLGFSGIGGLLPPQLLEAAATLAARGAGAAAVGVVLQGSNLGQLVGPLLIGGVVEAAGWSAATLPLLLACAGAAMLALGLRRAL